MSNTATDGPPTTRAWTSPGLATCTFGGGGQHVAAQFTYHGREYLAVDLGGANNLFNDWDDLLVEITGATGTIGANDFI